jgi:hypothetical protein
MIFIFNIFTNKISYFLNSINTWKSSSTNSISRFISKSNKINIKINKDEFKSLFGPNAKPRKGDYLSITKAQKKFKVKKK